MKLRRAVLLLALLLAAGCDAGAAIADTELALRIEPGASEVDFGKAFPLTVVRVWSKQLVPAVFEEQALAPLRLRLSGTTRRDDDRHAEETRRYDAYAFTPDQVTVPAVTFKARPRDGGSERAVSSAKVVLAVRAVPGAPVSGPPELPGELLLEPLPWRRWSLLAVGALAVLAVGGWYLRSRPAAARPTPTPSVPTVLPHDLALQRLARLRAQPPAGRAQLLTFHVELAALVRAYCAARFAVRALEMTTEELRAALPPTPRPLLAAVLQPCDLVKFAYHVPPVAALPLLLAAGEQFILTTRTAAATAAAPRDSTA